MKKPQLRKLLFIAVFVGLLSTTVGADDGLWKLHPTEYERLTVPETRLILVRNKDAWRTLIKFHFPNRSSEDTLGMALRDMKDGKYRYSIFMPHFKGVFESFGSVQEVLGHEFMHIIDYHSVANGGYLIFDPDK